MEKVQKPSKMPNPMTDIKKTKSAKPYFRTLPINPNNQTLILEPKKSTTPGISAPLNKAHPLIT
jgi:hypothetical protein